MIRQEAIAHAVRCIGLGLCLALSPVATLAQCEAAKQQPPLTAKQVRVFADFNERVKQYVDLQKKLEQSLPALGPKEPQEKIVERRKALAARIKEARSAAKYGDVFAPEIAEEFRRIIRSEFQGPKGAALRKTIHEGEPLPQLVLHVNDAYPETLPVTTMPPTLLLRLPELPKEVAYRIVGRNLLLLDVEANLIVDFVRRALP